METIWNKILEVENGKLSLRFAFEFYVVDLSPQEQKFYRE